MSPAKKPPPPWLDVTTPQNDRARIQRCPRCHQPIIRALVGRVAGLDIRADPHPLTLEEELAARLAGRFAWCLLIQQWSPPRLLDRGTEHIRAGRCQHVVVATHLCIPRRTPAPQQWFTETEQLMNPEPDALF